MEIVNKLVNELIPYARNSRTHSDEQVGQIMASIKEFGWTNPVLIDEDGGIIAGHGRVMAAQRMGVGEVPCITLAGLTEAQKKAYIIADNKLALNAGWDDEMLKIELQELWESGYSLDLTGFNMDELDDLGIGDMDMPELDDSKADEVPEIVENPVIKRGDLIELGNHRLLCGDSTKEEDVKRLMDGKKADMVFTDPPYNVAYNGRSGRHDVIKNDNLSDSDFEKFINESIATINRLRPEAYYIWCNWDFYGVLQGKLDYNSCIVWAKNIFGMGNGYRHQHEFCLYNGKIDEEIKNESDLWEVSKDTNYMHPTQKPVALSERAIGNHRRLINIVDLFGGSGSTLIGCENLNRKSFLMELDEKYAQVIIQRWCDYTSIDTIKINGEEILWSEYKDKFKNN
jgi:DNA modification methylase